jgi:hypothetical protein
MFYVSKKGGIPSFAGAKLAIFSEPCKFLDVFFGYFK